MTVGAAYLPLGALLVLATIHLVLATVLRPKYMEMEKLVDRVLNDPSANDVDRRWVSLALEDAFNRYEVPLLAIMLPFALIWEGLSSIFTVRKRTVTWQDDLEQLKASLNREEFEYVSSVVHADPTTGALWDTAARRRIFELSQTIQLLNSPISLVLMVMGLLVSAPALAFAHLTGHAVLSSSALRPGAKAKVGRVLLGH